MGRRYHPPHVVVGRILHAVVGPFLRAPLVHHALSHAIALVSITGRESGRIYTFPVFYRRQDDLVWLVVPGPMRGLWWRNLGEIGAPVRLWIRGAERAGIASAGPDGAGSKMTLVRLEHRTT